MGLTFAMDGAEGPTEFPTGENVSVAPTGPLADRLADKRWNWRSDAYTELEKEFRAPASGTFAATPACDLCVIAYLTLNQKNISPSTLIQ